MKGNFNELINDNRPVLVDFYADWCGPCKTLAPILKEVASELGEKARVIKIDVDKNQQLSQKFQVRGVPTLILFRKGEQLWRTSGVMQKRDLIQKIEEAL